MPTNSQTMASQHPWPKRVFVVSAMYFKLNRTVFYCFLNWISGSVVYPAGIQAQGKQLCLTSLLYSSTPHACPLHSYHSCPLRHANTQTSQWYPHFNHTLTYEKSEQRIREASLWRKTVTSHRYDPALVLLFQPKCWEENREYLTRLEGKENMSDEGQNAIVLHIPWLTEGLLQFFLYILFPIKQINLGLLEAREERRTSCGWKWEYAQLICILIFWTKM